MKGDVKMWKKTKAFLKGEEGSELIQWAVIIGITVGLAVMAYLIKDTIVVKLKDAQSVIDGFDMSGTTP